MAIAFDNCKSSQHSQGVSFEGGECDFYMATSSKLLRDAGRYGDYHISVLGFICSVCSCHSEDKYLFDLTSALLFE